MLAPHILAIVASSESIDQSTVDQLKNYTYGIANMIFKARTQVQRDKAVQTAVNRVLEQRPTKQPEVRKLLRDTLKSLFWESEEGKSNILNRIASTTTRISDDDAKELSTYAHGMATKVLETRTPAQRDEAVQHAILRVVRDKPTTRREVHRILRNELKDYFRKDDDRAKDHPIKRLTDKDYEQIKKGHGLSLSGDGFGRNRGHCYRLQLVELMDSCQSEIEKDFVHRVCLLNEDAHEVAADIKMSIGDMHRLVHRIT